MAESSLRILGLRCASCAGIVEDALARQAGVMQARVSGAAQCATVRWDPALTRMSTLTAAVAAAGYEAVPDTAASARQARQRESRAALWRLFVAAFCGMQVMMLAAPSYFSASGDLAPDLKHLLDWGAWLLTLPVLCFSAAPFFGGAWQALKHRRIGMDVPVALGVAVAFIASSGAAFDPGGVFGHEVWFDSLTMFVAFVQGGRYLEMRARHAAETALEATLAAVPELALRVAADGSVERVHAQALRPGDLVRVPVGQSCPADGTLVEGETEVDESLLTGESRAVHRGVGDPVVAGSLNRGAAVLMRVQRCGADTRHEAIVALMRAARTQRPTLLASADRWAAPFLWAVLVLAAAAGAVWSVIDPGRALWVVVSVLVVTCPCALSLAAPAALLAATGAMGRQGLLLRRLDAVQGLARMTVLFVDKTGTLTEPAAGRQVTVLTLPAAADHGGAAALQPVAASLAACSSHPLAQAVAQSLAQSLASPATPIPHWRSVREMAGQGVQGMADDGRRWRLGDAAWCGASAAQAALESAGPQVWFSVDGQPLLRFVLGEALRPGAAAAVSALQAEGVQLRLLSGDAPSRVHAVAQALGIEHSRGAQSPEDKLAVVAQAQHEGHCVAMLGDGINDAPVIARADVSIAMGEGAGIARSQADAVLVSNRLADLVRARRLARRTLRVIRQNMLWAAGYNAACIPMALLGWLPPWAAGAGMAASSLFVVLNSLRLAR